MPCKCTANDFKGLWRSFTLVPGLFYNSHATDCRAGPCITWCTSFKNDHFFQKFVFTVWYWSYIYHSIQLDELIPNMYIFWPVQGHQRSSEVTKGSKPSNYGRTEPISRNIFKIHMFRLKILWRIQIQNYLRSNQVTKSHQRSNFGQNGRIEVKLGR